MNKKVFYLILFLIISNFLLICYALSTIKITPKPLREKFEPPNLTQAETAFLYEQIKQLEVLHQKLERPKPGDWLFTNKEKGQTFAQYLKISPTIPTKKRNKIYVQPIGDFTPKQRKIVESCAQFLQIYYQVQTKILPDVPTSAIPNSARRGPPDWVNTQISTTFLLDTLLRPGLPEDAAVYLGFTAEDLWPGGGYNFVYGEAYLRYRVGVWSIFHYGDPEKSEKMFRLCLLRAMKTSTHETGHMFSIKHCVAWKCNMNGSNYVEQEDLKPLALCPECLAKICWGREIEPIERLTKIVEFCKKQGLEHQFFIKEIELLKEAKNKKEEAK